MSDMEDHSPAADLDASEVFSTLTESGVIDPDVIHDIIGVEIAVSTSASPATTPPPATPIPASSFDEQQTAEEEDRDDTDSITTTNSDHSSVKPNRELKSILALSKEAKLETNISHKRKTLDSVKSRENSPKITKEEHQETVKKIIRIVSAADGGGGGKMAKYPVTAESEIETQSDDEKMPNKVKRKRDSLAELSPGGATDDSSRKSKKSFTQDVPVFKNPVRLFQEGKDLFCWRCHRDGVNIACETCPRSFHQKCLKQVIIDTEHWPCPECVAILKAESTSTRSEAMKGMTLEHLCSLLKFAQSRMVQCTGSEPFIHPVNEKEFPIYKKYIIQPMNLTLLEKNIKDNLYGSTQAFEADAKWILHNSIIFNSYQSKITTAARGIVKICKQEMAEIENCPSCYLNANTKKNTWFVEVCPRPHLLVWAKLKGFPYWPAKAMCTNSAGMVDVRFFGAHDRAWVHYRDCYLYSDRDPNSYKQRRYDIENCVKELQLYVNNLKKIYGDVHLAPFKTLYDPDNEERMLKMLLPTYRLKGLRVYEKTGGTDGVKNKDEQEKSGEVEIKTEPEENSELNFSKTDSLNNTIEGYGTDEDNKCNIDAEKRKLLELNEDLVSQKDDEDDTQLKIRIANKLIKANAKTKSSFSEKLRALKRNSTEKMIEMDKSRRNSVQSEDSDKMNCDETMEQSVNVSITSSVSDLSTKSTDNCEQKRKPVQVNIENSELSLSPQNKLKMTDKLIKRLSDGDENTTKNMENVENDDQSCSSTTKETTTQNVNQVESVNSTVDDEKTVKEPSIPENNVQSGKEKDEEDKQEPVVDKETNKSDVIEEAEDSEGADPIDSSQINEADIRNIIHSSLNECNITITPKEKPKTVENTAKTDVTSTTTENKKRKLSNEEPESQPKPKSIKVININKVIDKDLLRETIESTRKERSKLKNKERQSTETDSSDSNEKQRKIRRNSTSSTHSMDHDDQTIPQDLLAIEIKSEQESEGECSDIDYMEAKRKYLSALNISEKQKETITREKMNHEIRTRSKTEEKKERSKIDNLTRIIDEVALNTTGTLDNRKMEKKKLVATVLSSSAPLTAKNASGEIFVKQLSKMQSPKHRARKTFPTPKYDKPANGVPLKEILPKPAPANSVTVAKVLVSSSAVDPLTILTQSHNPEVVLIPTNQAGNYSMMPPLIATKSLKQIVPNTKQSQNYIPQNESDTEAPSTLLDTILNKPGLQKSVQDGTSSSVVVPTTSIIPILTTTASTSTATIITTTATTSTNQQDTQDELSILHTTVPRTLSRAVSDLLCRSMPKLKPRPPGVLSTTFDSGVPSSAGPVAAKINSVAHRLGDYFRGMLIETLEDLSKTDDTEATIVKLKLEIETLKHKHEMEMAEMQRNVSTILKDIQTSIVEERNRVIEQVRATSEAEAQRRVEEAKSKQWCANCSKEAQFYCCWNTSYCDYPCQQKHWPKHMNKCTQNQTASSSSASPTTIRSQTGQQIVLRPTNPPKGGFNRVFSKPTKVYMNRSGGSGSGAPKTLTAFKTSTNNHITLVESTPGKFELLTNGPIVTHKIVAAKQNDATTTAGGPTASKTKSTNNNTKSSSANTSKSQNVKETECES